VTSSPTWLYYAFGVAMIVVAGYGAVLLALGVATRRPAGWDVDVAHTFMGVVMAGMFVSGWSLGSRRGWELVFSALAAWFAFRSARSIRRAGRHVPHESIHAVMSVAMVLMLWFVVTPVADQPMAMGPGAITRIDPGLTLVLAFLLLGSAVFTLASPVKGISHHGSRPQFAGLGATDGEASVTGIERVIAAPLLEDVSHVAMCVAMAFMLILMN
jgi:Domain of unknown function (DUF5134)